VDDTDLAPTAGAGGHKHILVVFGGVAGIEDVVANDSGLTQDSAEAPSLFDWYLNTCPAQGSNTIRTEEAMLVTLSVLRPKLFPARGPGQQR
jgi:predicted SPOUT superfamily RNA methylase MTH1